MKFLSLLFAGLLLVLSSVEGLATDGAAAGEGVALQVEQRPAATRDSEVTVPSDVKNLTPAGVIDSVAGVGALGISAGDNQYAPGAIMAYFVINRFLANFENIASLFGRCQCGSVENFIQLVRYDEFVQEQFSRMSGTSYVLLQSLFHWLQDKMSEEYETDFSADSLTYRFNADSSYPGVVVSVRVPNIELVGDAVLREADAGVSGGEASGGDDGDDDRSSDVSILDLDGDDGKADDDGDGEEIVADSEEKISRTVLQRILNTSLFKMILPAGKLDYLQKSLGNGDVYPEENDDGSISFYIRSIEDRRARAQESILEVRVSGVDVSTGEVRERTVVKKEKTVWDGLNGLAEVLSTAALAGAVLVDYYVEETLTYTPWIGPATVMAKSIFAQLPAFWETSKRYCGCLRRQGREPHAPIDFFDFLLGTSQFLNAEQMKVITYFYLVLEDRMKRGNITKTDLWDAIEYTVTRSESDAVVGAEFRFQSHRTGGYGGVDDPALSFGVDAFHRHVLGSIFATHAFPRDFLNSFNELMGSRRIGWVNGVSDDGQPERRYVFLASRHASCEVGGMIRENSPVFSLVIGGRIASSLNGDRADAFLDADDDGAASSSPGRRSLTGSALAVAIGADDDGSIV